MKDYKRLTEKTKLGTYIIGDDSPIIQRLGELEDLIESNNVVVIPKGRCSGKSEARRKVLEQLIESGELVSKDWHDEQVMIYEDFKQKIEQQELVSLNSVAKLLNNWFDSPCAYGLNGEFVAEYMFEKCGDWCEENCDKMMDDSTGCWEMFLKTKLAELRGGK